MSLQAIEVLSWKNSISLIASLGCSRAINGSLFVSLLPVPDADLGNA